VFIDAIHFSVRDSGIVNKKAVYVVLAITSEGMKEVLGLYVGENESSKYWLGVLNDLKNRNLKDILILCSDGLTGLKEAIEAAYPKTEHQRCIVHQVRNTLKYVSHKDKKEFAKDLKRIYTAKSEETGAEILIEVDDKWNDKYPNAMTSWTNNWDVISPFFKYSKELRKVMYTTYTEKKIMPIFPWIPYIIRVPMEISA
jgi:transposase-like protein